MKPTDNKPTDNKPTENKPTEQDYVIWCKDNNLNPKNAKNIRRYLLWLQS